jgi:hypothetical protein
MKRKWIVWTAFAVAWSTAALVATMTASRPNGPPTLSAPDVPKLAFKDRLPPDRRVRIVLRFPLAFSPDRTVGRYSPSAGGTATPTMELHFNRPVAGDPRVVTGTVSGFRYDMLARLNRLPGLAVIVACEADPDRP